MNRIRELPFIVVSGKSLCCGRFSVPAETPGMMVQCLSPRVGRCCCRAQTQVLFVYEILSVIHAVDSRLTHSSVVQKKLKNKIGLNCFLMKFDLEVH